MKNLYKALLSIQGELNGVVKDAQNPHFKNKYVSLAEVLKVVRPACQNHGVVMQLPPAAYQEGVMSVDLIVAHAESGEIESYRASCPVAKSDPQGAMAACTYLQRYLTLGAFSLPSLDDDAESAVVTTADLAKSLRQCSTPEELNKWGLDMADTIQAARGNKAELKRNYAEHMNRLKQLQEGCSDE